MATPGFDDFTADWGNCSVRAIPRDPALLDGQFDWFAAEKQAGALSVRGLLFETWDDWTEGSELEPDVVDGPAKLVQARQRVGQLFGDPSDPAGDAALASRWSGFGQARNCCFAGGACDAGVGAPIDLVCPGAPDGGAGDAAVDLARGAAMDARGTADFAQPELPAAAAGCACATGGRPSRAPWLALLLVSSLLRRGRAGRCRRAGGCRSR
jgi:hypothetical protein